MTSKFEENDDQDDIDSERENSMNQQFDFHPDNENICEWVPLIYLCLPGDHSLYYLDLQSLLSVNMTCSCGNQSRPIRRMSNDICARQCW